MQHESKDTNAVASPDDVCSNCSRTRKEHTSSICVTGGFCKFPVRQTVATLGVPVYLYPSYPRYDTEPCIVVQVTGRYLGDGWREKVEAVYAKLREVFPQDG